MTNHPNRMQVTIRLTADSYHLTDGVVQAFYATETGHQFDYSNPSFIDELDKCQSWDWHATRYAVGTPAVLVSVTDASPNAIRAGENLPRYHLSFNLDGVPGNSDPKIKTTSGWRGTTNDSSVSAHGVVTIRKIRTLKNGDIAVTVR